MMAKAEVQPGEGGRPASGFTILGLRRAEHALDDRPGRVRFAQPGVGHQVEELTSGQQPVVGRDQAPEGVDCLASGVTEAGP
jgi:hypothetical protein